MGAPDREDEAPDPDRGPDSSTRRRLDRAPGERYTGNRPDDATPSTGGDPVLPGGSVARAAAFALPGALIADMVYIALAGPFAFSAGLVVVGIFAGRIVGLSAKLGAGVRVPSDSRVVVALLVTLAWFAVAQVGTWLYARSEGGVLPILDYLLQAFGPVVPLTAIAAVLAAWWSAR